MRQIFSHTYKRLYGMQSDKSLSSKLQRIVFTCLVSRVHVCVSVFLANCWVFWALSPLTINPSGPSGAPVRSICSVSREKLIRVPQVEAKCLPPGKYGFHLHEETYIVSSGSSDSISFDTVVGGLFRISIFSIGPKLF
jgi:hypothetical protein